MVDLLVGAQFPRESKKAILACNDYLRMGAGRSLAKLHQKYTAPSPTEPPTRTLRVLKGWSSKFDWQQRASDYDATWEERKNAEREREFNEGIALDFERVRKLKRLAEFLETQIYEQIEERISALVMDENGELERQAVMQQRYGRLWVKDVKGIGRGEDFERVEIVRFNQALLAEFRAALDDISKETGGRIHRHEHAGPEGQAIPLAIDGMADVLQMMGLLDKHGRAGEHNPPE